MCQSKKKVPTCFLFKNHWVLIFRDLCAYSKLIYEDSLVLFPKENNAVSRFFVHDMVNFFIFLWMMDLSVK